jgi:hypothetical protein
MSQKKQSEHGIRFALHLPSERMVTPAEVKRGRACECVCVACQSPLVARKGEIRIAHFAHLQDSDCPYAAEAAIHWMAKQIIAERGCIFVPHRVKSKMVLGKRSVWKEEISVDVQAQGLVVIEDCQVEKKIAGASGDDCYRRPDLIAKLDGIPLAIEICNTHAVDFEKEEWLEQKGYSVLEINVNDLAPLPTEEYRKALEKRLFSESVHAKWLVHLGDSKAGERLEQLELELRLVYQPEEDRLLSLLEAQEAEKKRQQELYEKALREHEEARKRKAAFPEKIRDVEATKLRIDNCTIRVGRNNTRVALKAYGYPTKDICQRIAALAKAHGGKFVPKILCWEFYPANATKPLFDELSRRVLTLMSSNFFDTLKPAVAPAKTLKNAIPKSLPELPPLPQYFDAPDLQELFDERAGMLEYESGLTREEAERQSFEYVRAIEASRTSTSRGVVLHASRMHLQLLSVGEDCSKAVVETSDDAVIRDPVVREFAFA